MVNYGIEHATALCMELARHGHRGLHFYTLNRETVVIEILKRLHMWQRPSPERPLLPWKRSGNARRRAAELVRPIFWSERTNTYLYRTSGWTSFPNGRWSDTSNPDFGMYSFRTLYDGLSRDVDATIFFLLPHLRRGVEWRCCHPLTIYLLGSCVCRRPE